MSKQIDGTEFACLTINADLEAENEKLINENKILAKALELACLVISKAMCPNGDWEMLKKDFANAYKQQAEKELKNEQRNN